MRSYTFLLAALIAFYSSSSICAVESVQPLSAPLFKFYSWDGHSSEYIYPSADSACAAWESLYPQYSSANGFARGVNPVCHYDKNSTSLSLSSTYSNNVPVTCPSATPAYTFNPVTSLCERPVSVDCPVAGTVASSGFYNIGTVRTDSHDTPPLLVCSGGCELQYEGDNAQYGRVISGVVNYYARGLYRFTSEVCTGGSDLPPVLSAPPPESCAHGQTLVTFGKRTKCYNSSTGVPVSTDSASAVAAASSAAAAKQASVIDAATAAATAAGGDASAVKAAAVQAAATVAAQAAQAGQVDQADRVPPVSFCEENPTASSCAPTDYGTVEDVDLTHKSVSVSILPVQVGGAGYCPAPTPYVLHGRTLFFDWATYCNYALGIRPILLAFAWLAAAGILIGGFRS